jgi:hypothetical protein
MVIPVSGAGSSRVTHPFAGLPTPEGVVLPRLACVRRAASVRPEPGSNSPLETRNATTTRRPSPQSSDPWKSAPCAVPSKKDPPGHDDFNPISRTAGSPKRTCCPEISSYSTVSFQDTRSIPKTGCMYTDFWHTVQFSRSGTRPSPNTLPQAHARRQLSNQIGGEILRSRSHLWEHVSLRGGEDLTYRDVLWMSTCDDPRANEGLIRGCQSPSALAASGRMSMTRADADVNHACAPAGVRRRVRTGVRRGRP